jgi:ABC-2 type transport system permease protein
MFGLVSLLMVGSFAYTQILVFLVDRSATILDRLKFIYYPAHLLAKSLLENDIFALLAFLSGSLTVFGLFIIAIQKQYRNINARLKESFQSSNYQMESLTPFSMFQAIFKKDVKRYFSSTIYLLNTSFGMFLMVIVAIASIFVGTKALEVLVGTDTSEIPIFPILLTMQVAFIAMSCTTSPSISLEGKYLWILKSMPIDPKLIYKSKILLNLTVIIPIHLISVVLLSIAFKLGFIELVLLILVPSAYALAIASGGLLINIIKPSFQWESEVVPVKQSMSVMLAMLWGVFLLAIPIAIYTNVSIENIYIFASLVGLVVLLISMGVLRWINTLGVKKYYEF